MSNQWFNKDTVTRLSLPVQYLRYRPKDSWTEQWRVNVVWEKCSVGDAI